MASDISADQNFYPRHPNDHPSSSSSCSLLSSDQTPLRLQHIYDPAPLPPFETSAPHAQLPPKLPLLTTTNLHAPTTATATASTNGYGDVNGSASGDGLTHGVDPAEFYYRGAQQSPHGYTETTTNGTAMATTDSRPPAASLRSNGNGTTARHPTIPARGVKNSYRSVSSPLEERLALSAAKSTPSLSTMPRSGQSVKDLLKRFDQNNESSSSSPVRKPVPRMVTKENASVPGYMRERTGYMGRTTGNLQSTTSTSRAGSSTRDAAGRKSPEKLRTTQRSRFATEDQFSNNTLSGAPRSSRPRNNTSGSNSQASKSMTNLSPTAPTSNSNSSQTPARQPLFGEVLPIGQGQGSDSIAYGIPNAVATRQTSDSNLHPTWQRQRSRSDVDISPSSPTAWYKGLTPALDDVDPNKPPRSIHGHNRNHSDFADSKANTMSGVTPSFASDTNVPSVPQIPSTHPAPSRLPISSQRLSDSSGSSSPTSTRASSPFTSKVYANGKMRKAEVPNRSKTPTQSFPRGKARKPEPAPNGSLKAYISAPPEKTSPPLRSSRPRQPVSAASTNSSRQRAMARTGSPTQNLTSVKLIRNAGPPGFDYPPRREIVDTGPVDYSGLQNKIRRAYTKSMDKEQQKRQREENERRLRERDRERVARDSLEQAGKESTAKVLRPETPPPVPSLEPQLSMEKSSQIPPSSPPSQPLQISTTFFTDVSLSPSKPAQFDDSPTLGMPGTFIVEDDAPPSAISTATASTEIDNEPQTEAARRKHLPSMKHNPHRLSSNVTTWANELSPEQAMYGISHEQESIHIRLDPSIVEPSEPTPTKIGSPDPSVPGAYQEEPDSRQAFTSTGVAASPEERSSAPSRTDTVFESGDEQGSSRAEHTTEPTSSNESVNIVLQNPPQISLPDQDDYYNDQNYTHGPRLQLPDVRKALAPPSVASNEASSDFLNTPVTDMDYDSSDGAGEQPHSEHEVYQRVYETPHKPIASLQSKRSSHQSSWTDYSYDSRRGYTDEEDYTKVPSVNVSLSELSNHSFHHLESGIPPVPPKPEGYSPLPSPKVSSPTTHHLPPLTASDSFGFGFAEQTLNSVPSWPDHAPPPIPEQSDKTAQSPFVSQQNRRPPSSVDQSSHNGASQHPESRRQSDDLYSPRPSVSTPRSSTQVSLEDSLATTETAQTETEREASEALAKRLKKRKNEITELVSTEALYLKDMNVVEEIYKGTAEACPKLDSTDIRTIFRNTDEIVVFETSFLDDLRASASSVLPPRSSKSRASRVITGSPTTTASDRFSMATTLHDDLSDEQRDLQTSIGACFGRNMKKIEKIYTTFLKSQESSSKRLGELQTDAAVKVWLNECNTVAKDLTHAWNIDALLVKPFQRLTRYSLMLNDILKITEDNHPDYSALELASRDLMKLLKDLNDMKARLERVGEIVKPRKRKESNVRLGFLRKKDKEDSSTQLNTRDEDDPEYLKLHEKYNDNYLRMQVVLRDVEYHLRQCQNYVNDDLRYKSAMELVMRLSASPWPEIESKWARFNMSMRDMGTVALDQHTGAIRTQVIEPFEKMIQLYGPPGLAMRKRAKRRVDYEKISAAKKSGSKLSEKDQVKLEQYEALTETLKDELPRLFEKTEEIGKLLLGHFVVIQTRWYDVWQKKVKVVLEESQIPKEISEIVPAFQRDYKYVEEEAQKLGIINGSLKATAEGSPELSDSAFKNGEKKSRPSDLSTRSRGPSVSDRSPSLPTPDFVKRNSGGQFSFPPLTSPNTTIPHSPYQPHQYQQPYSTGHSRQGSGSPAIPDAQTYRQSMGRPSTSRSFTSASDAPVRMSNDYNNQSRRESGSTYYSASHHQDGPPISSRPYSGIFHSAMPLPDGPEDSTRSSRASSRDRNVSGGYNVLYLAASLFEFNIAASKSEAGYPYLTYQAGEIFDVIGEKGELWLAKNQDDPTDKVGWIWSKHFARLATD